MSIYAILGTLLLVLVAALAAPRIIAAAQQCAFPVFAHTASCFAHDVLTGEDL